MNQKTIYSQSSMFIFVIIYIICVIMHYINTEFFLTTFSDYICFSFILVVYANAEKEKATAIKCNRKKSGIYRWTHKESGKSYIASSVNLGHRFSNYFSLPHFTRQAKSSVICKALLNYSEFSLEIVEYCEINEVLKREQFYLDSLNPEYNILKTAGSLSGYIHTEQAKAKITSFLTGRKASEARKSTQRASKLGLARSEATKAKLKEHLTNLNKRILAKKRHKGNYFRIRNKY